MKKILCLASIFVIVCMANMVYTSSHKKSELESYLVNCPADIVTDLEKQNNKIDNDKLPDDCVAFSHFRIVAQKQISDAEYYLYGRELQTDYYLSDMGELVEDMDLEETDFPVILYVQKTNDKYLLRETTTAVEDDGAIKSEIPEIVFEYLQTKTEPLLLSDYYQTDKKKAEQILKKR